MIHDPSRLHSPDRLAALARTRLLDSPPEEPFDRLARLASRLIRAPVALISLVDDHRQYFKSRVGLAPGLTGTPLSHSFCQYVVASDEDLVVADAREHPLVRDNGAVTELGAVAYAGVPLRTPEGHTLGAMCVIDGEARAWTSDDLDTLRELARSVMTEVALRERVFELQREAAVRERFISVLAHDLRQPLSTMTITTSLLLADRGHGDEDRRKLERMRLAGARMGRLVGDLLDLAHLGHSAIPVTRRPADLHALARRAVDELAAAHPSARIEVECVGEAGGRWDPDRVMQLVGNLVGNAVQYGREGSPVRVRSEGAGDRVSLAVQNANRGGALSAEARLRLFDAFERGAEAGDGGAQRNLGLGLYIVDQIAGAHGGTVAVESTDEGGTTFTVHLPRD